MLEKVWTSIFAIALALVLTVAVAQLLHPAVPALIAIGLAITAAAPLCFLAWAQRTRVEEKNHPVAISAAMGLGCATIMIGIQRFGDEHRWVLFLALLSLGAWMIYQRYHWRSGQQKGGGSN